MSVSGADEPLGSWEEIKELLCFVGDANKPSEFCRYLVQPFLDGSPGAADVASIFEHAQGCVFCQKFLDYYYRDTNSDGH